MEPAIPGTLLADRYLLLRPLGTGGSATVWEAVDTARERPVAVKLLRGAAVNDTTERERLRREARVLARLAHPRICAIRDYFETPRPDGSTVPVLVTELLTGTSLARRLKEGPLPWAEAVHVCAQIADALLAAHHAGIVHRDVKPANVVLVPDGAKLLDFGIARGRGDGDLTGNLTVGTPLCMAPEQVRGQRARPASDIYALGCVLFWSLTGRPPYQSNDITEVFESQLYDPPPPIDVPGLPARVIDFCHACLSKNPAFRPNAAQALTTLSGLAAAAGIGLGDEYGRLQYGGARPIAGFQAVADPAASARPRVDRRPPASPGPAAPLMPAAPSLPPIPPLPALPMPGEETMLSGAFDDGGDGFADSVLFGLSQGGAADGRATGDPAPDGQSSADAAFDGRVRPRVPVPEGSGRGPGNRGRRYASRSVLLAVTALVVLLGVGGLALALASSRAPAGPVSAGPVPPPAAAASKSAPATPTGGLQAPTISAAAAGDPIRYLEAVRAQIRTFVADGPATLDPTTGGDLQNSIVDIENSVISAKRNGGAAHIREIRAKIAQFDGRLDQLVGRERISPTAANQLTAEVQRLSNTVTD